MNEKLRLKDIIEDVGRNPKQGETTEAMKKELNRLKVAENREEPFAKETRTYYTRTDDRSRYNNWKRNLKLNGYRRLDSGVCCAAIKGT